MTSRPNRSLAPAFVLALVAGWAAPAHARNPVASPEVPDLAAPVRVGGPVPAYDLVSVGLQRMNPDGVRGRYLLLVFCNPSVRNLGVRWYRDHAEELLSLENLTIHNIVHFADFAPSVPRKAILERFSGEVVRILDQMRERLPAELRAGLGRLDLHWYLDLDGKCTRSFGAPTDRLTLLLVGPDGQVVEHQVGVDDRGITRIVRRIQHGRARVSGPEGRLGTRIEELRRRRGEARR